MKLIFDVRDEFFTLTDTIQADFKRAAEFALKEESYATNYEISVSFVSDDEIRNINCKYRGLDEVTDVLSFPLEMENFSSDIEIPLGDVVISYDRAQSQAKEYGHSLRRELLYLFVHSMFHLMGHDHEQEAEQREMRNREETVMAKLEATRDDG